MSNPRDNGPLAPRRPLSKAGAPAPAGANGASSPAPSSGTGVSSSGGSSGVSPSVSTSSRTTDAPTQPVMTPPYGGNPQPYSAVEVEPGRTFPVPPAPGDQGDHRDDGTATQKVDKRKLRADRRGRGQPAAHGSPGQAETDARRPVVGDQGRRSCCRSRSGSCASSRSSWSSRSWARPACGQRQRDHPGRGQPEGQRPFDIKDYVGMSRVMGITMLISAIDVVLITALATLAHSSTTWLPRCSAASRSRSPRTSSRQSSDPARGRLSVWEQ